MQLIKQAAYSNLVLPLFHIVLRIKARKSAKIRETLHGHKGALQRLQIQLADRDSAKPLAWFHVASAGELLLAQPVMQELVKRGYQFGVTVTSPSGFRWLERADVFETRPVFRDYLPLDTARNADRLLRLIRPDVLIYIKYDIWPNLAWSTRKAGVPQVLIAGSLHRNSGRYRNRLVRCFFRDVLGSLNVIFAIAEEDRARFLEIVPHHPRVETLGSTNFDSVLERKKRLAQPQVPISFTQGKAIVVGSCWPSDDEITTTALQNALSKHLDLRIIIAPHEIKTEYLSKLSQRWRAFGVCKLGEPRTDADTRARVMLVDSVGQLAALYDLAGIAYVGGAFNKSGVHNVVEAAARGVPSIFGPVYENSEDAMQLVKHKLAFTVENNDEFNAVLASLLDDAKLREDTRRKLNDFVQKHTGVAIRYADTIQRLVEHG